MMQQSQIQSSQSSRDMDVSKNTNKTNLLNLLVLRAWRERWTDSQWGINIKTVLPRGVSGDVYNLADCLLKQALVGSTANELVLNLLKHSLCSQLISHAAVLRRVTTYNFFDRLFCLTTLLEFLDSIMESVTCRNKQEELILPNALVQLVKWIMQIFPALVNRHELKGECHTDQVKLFEQYCSVVKRFVDNQFLLSVLYVGRQEDALTYGEICQHYAVVKSIVASSSYTPPNTHIEPNLQCLAYIDLSHLKLPVPHLYGNDEAENNVEAVTYIVQPLLAVDVLLNPTKETVFFVHEMQMIQRLKNFSNARLYYEIIRSGLISLSNMLETSHDTMWGAFTFFKIPQIIKSLHVLTPSKEEHTASDHIPEVLEAFEMILDDNLLLDIMDTKCSCNIIEYVLNDWTKHHLVNETQSKNFAAQREKTSSMLQKRDTNNPQAPSIINFIIRAEVPLNGILKTLSTDYNKVQEALLGVLCQVLVGNSFDLILSVATVEGRLRTFISRLIQCNENSKQVAGETGKQQAIRSTLFDVSFLMLTFITQTYGAEIVLSANNYVGKSFFERWVRECMVERNRPKNPINIIALCDEDMVDELLLTLSKPDAQTKNSLNWEDICMTLPAVLHHVLVAWEHEALTSTDVKGILDNIKRRLFCYSVCATSYLCAYMYSVREHEFLKPLNMIQQFLAPSNNEELSPQDNVKERMALAFLIIRKMQHDVHPSGTYKPRSIALTQSLVSNTPIIEQFREVWKTVVDSGYVSVRSAQMLESLLQAGGPVWLARYLIEEILRCKYVRDMSKTMDIVFATLHLDIVRCTSALLEEVIPLLVQNRQGEDVNEPQLLVLANLCVFCIISCVEMQNAESTYGYMRKSLSYDAASGATEVGATIDGTPDANKKRARSNDADDLENRSINSKARKLASSEDASSSIDDFSNESQLLAEAAASLDSLSSAAGEQSQKKLNSNTNNNNKIDDLNKGIGSWSLSVTHAESTTAGATATATTECYDDEEASRNSLAEAIASVSGIVSAVNNDIKNKSIDDACTDAEAAISNMSSSGSGATAVTAAATVAVTNSAESMECTADSNGSGANVSKDKLVEIQSDILLSEDKTDRANSDVNETALKPANVVGDDVDGTIGNGGIETGDDNESRADALGSKTPEKSIDTATGEQSTAATTDAEASQGSEKEKKNKEVNDDAVVISGVSVGDGSAVDLNAIVDEIAGDTGKKINDVTGTTNATGVDTLKNSKPDVLTIGIDGSDVASVATTTIITTTKETATLTMSDLAAVDAVLGVDAVDGDGNSKNSSTKNESNSSTITTAAVVTSQTVTSADNAGSDLVSPTDDSQIYEETAAGNLGLNAETSDAMLGITAENIGSAAKTETAVEGTTASAAASIMSVDDCNKLEALVKKDALTNSCDIEDISEDAVDGILDKVAESSDDILASVDSKEEAKKVDSLAADNSTENSNSANAPISSNNNSNADSAVKSTTAADICDIDMPNSTDDNHEQSTTSAFLDMSEGNSVSAELNAADLDVESARDSTTSDMVVEVVTAAAAAAGSALESLPLGNDGGISMDVDADINNLVGGDGSGDGDTLAQAFAAADVFNLDEEATFSGRLAALAQLEGEDVIGGFGDNDNKKTTTSTASPILTNIDSSTKSSNLVTTSIDNNNENDTATSTTAISSSSNSNLRNSLPEDDVPSTSGISSGRTVNSSSTKNNSSSSSSAQYADKRQNITILQVKRLPRYSNELREPLATSVQALFKAFQQFVTTEELSPKVYFVHQFITLLVERGGERVRPVLNLLPTAIMPSLLKILLNDEISCGLITRLYNLDTATGRQKTISDLCLWQNINLKQGSTQM